MAETGATSCVNFCAYHGSVRDLKSLREFFHGVHTDMQGGSGCEAECGPSATLFDNYTSVASHEMVETITDGEIGLFTITGKTPA